MNITLKFTGYYANNFIELDSIKIENLTQSGDTMLYYPDTTLSLLTVGQEKKISENAEFILYQNYPNPVLDKSTIKLYIPKKDKVVIKITDLLGRVYGSQVQILEPGYHSFVFTPGIAKTYIISAGWRGSIRNVKVFNQGNSEGNTPSLSYSVKTVSNKYQKSLKSSKGINFNVGDSLKFTGYSFSLEDNIYDIFGVSTNYTFQFYQFTLCSSAFIDFRDSNVYQTVQIGNQCWMAENVAYLPSVSPPDSGSYTSSYYYVYGYNDTIVTAAKATPNYQTYGVLYNWPAAMNGDTSSNSVPSGVQGVCPLGWHLPSDAEWDTIVNYLGGSSVAGGAMKETGFSHWNTPNTGAINSSGFTALPGGSRFDNGSFFNIGVYGFWWCSRDYDAYSAKTRLMYYLYGNVYRANGSKEYGFAVRCLRD